MQEAPNSSKIKYNFDEIIERRKTDSIKFDLRNYRFGTENIQPMWVADMDFATPAFIRDAIIERANHPIYGYTLRSEELYESANYWLRSRYNWKIKNDWLSFSPGVVPALNLCVLAFSEPGDGIIVQPPVYFPFFSAITNHKRKILYNQLIERNNRYLIDFEDFEKKARKASMFFLCHPHNPVGRVWTLDELSKMVEICLRHKVLIISDEIHADLTFNAYRHIPISTLGEAAESNTITCISPSKTFNLAGLSTSLLIIPDKTLKTRYETILDNIHVGAGNIFGNIALISAYRYGEEWLAQLILYLEGNSEYLARFIKTRIPEVSISPLEATYLVWIDFRKLNLPKKQLKNFLHKRAGIGMNEGEMFGPGGEGFHRMNIAVPRIKLTEALLKLENAIIDLRKENR